MKKSTLRRLQAQTNNEATASNLNRVMGKRDARIISSITGEEAEKYLASVIKQTKAEFRKQFEERSFGRFIDAKAVRLVIASFTIDDVEAVKTCTGTIDTRKLVAKAVAKADKAAKAEAAKAERKAQAEATKEAKAAAKAIDKAAETALASILEEAA